MKFKKLRYIDYFSLLAFCIIFFQNCSKANFKTTETFPSSAVPNVVSNGLSVRSKTVQITSLVNKVDFLLVIDNSGSMEDDAIALAQRLSDMFSNLNSAQIDWQMCLTTTNALSSGQSYSWQGANSGILLNAKSGDLNTIIPNTIRYLFSSTYNNGDERGIAQAYMHMMNGTNSSCYRDKAMFAPLFISDEDERSTGTTDYSWVSIVPDLVNTSTGPIENIDRPEFLLSDFAKRFPAKKIQAHAIVIQSDDLACFQQQDFFANVSFGKFYENFANLTGGTVTSICESDFSRNLNQISANIISLSQNLQMDCDPASAPSVVVSPVDSEVHYQIIGRQIALSYPSNKSYSVTLNYSCK